jgi:trigger factor
MQVSVENTSTLERRVTVQIPAEDIKGKVEDRLRELSKRVQIKGFRPGKIPMNVMHQRYGAQVRNEIVGEAMQQSLEEAIQKEELRPASMPRLEPMEVSQPEDDLQFTAVIEVLPELDPVEVSELEIERPEAEVTESDVDDMLETLRQQRTTWVPVDRSPEKGDQVLIEYVAQTDEGRVPVQGKQRIAILMGDSGFKSLEKAVAKLKATDKTEAKLKFPDDYREESLNGKKANVELEVIGVSESTVPEVDEEFIKSFGIESGDEEELRTEIRANLDRELKQACTSLVKVTLINTLIDSHPDLAVPDSMVRSEATNMAAQVARGQGETPDEAQVDAFMDTAQKRVRGGLIMSELARQNGIRIDGARVRETIEVVAETYEQPDEVRQMYFSNPQLLQQVENAVLEEQVVDWVMENAKVSPKAMAFKEVIEAAAHNR